MWDLVLIGAVLLLVALILAVRYWPRLKLPERFGFVSNILLGVLCVFLGAILTRRMEQSSTAAIHLQRPYLISTLQVNSLESGERIATFVVRNEGSRAARGLMLWATGTHGSAFSSRKNRTDVWPGDSISWKLVKTQIPASADLRRIKLHAAYWSPNDGSQEHYTSVFDFSLLPSETCTGVFTPRAVDRTRRQTDPREEAREAMRHAIDKPTGSCFSWFSVTGIPAQAETVLLMGGDLGDITYWPRTRQVRFRLMSTNGIERNVFEPLGGTPTQQWHFIGATWSPTQLFCFVDGESTSLDPSLPEDEQTNDQ